VLDARALERDVDPLAHDDSLADAAGGREQA
jgi:hypothetical protein